MPNKSSGYRRSDNGNVELNEAAVEKMLRSRISQKKLGNEAEVDRIAYQLFVMGIYVDDKNKEWSVMADVGGSGGGRRASFRDGAGGLALAPRQRGAAKATNAPDAAPAMGEEEGAHTTQAAARAAALAREPQTSSRPHAAALSRWPWHRNLWRRGRATTIYCRAHGTRPKLSDAWLHRPWENHGDVSPERNTITYMSPRAGSIGYGGDSIAGGGNYNADERIPRRPLSREASSCKIPEAFTAPTSPSQASMLAPLHQDDGGVVVFVVCYTTLRGRQAVAERRDLRPTLPTRAFADPNNGTASDFRPTSGLMTMWHK